MSTRSTTPKKSSTKATTKAPATPPAALSADAQKLADFLHAPAARSVTRTAELRAIITERLKFTHGKTTTVASAIVEGITMEPTCLSVGLLEDIRVSLAIFQAAVHNHVSNNAEDLAIDDADFFLWRLQKKVELAADLAGLEQQIAIEDAVAAVSGKAVQS